MPSHRDSIARLSTTGLSQRAIARELGVAPATVGYHLRRLDNHAEECTATATPKAAVRVSGTRARVAELLGRGVPRADIARQLGLSKGTISYHARRLGVPIDERCARRYDWKAVQRYYDGGHSVRQCIQSFGFSSASWHDAVKRGAIVPRPAAIPIAVLLAPGTYRGRFNLKLRLLRDGLKENRCARCGLTEWRGEPLTLALHHVNGERHDNRLDNLELLCPNCHSQTENYAGRNGRGRRDRGLTKPPAHPRSQAMARGGSDEQPA